MSKGFTLIELLVVIAIIGILSSVVLASLNSARVKARDARRVSDIKQLQVALELYNDAVGSYPTALTALTGGGPGASLGQLPTDPSRTSESYRYAFDPVAAPTKYHLGASLEQAAGATTLDDTDRDLNSTNTGTGAQSFNSVDPNAPFNAIDGAMCTGAGGGATCYDVSNI